MAKPETNTTGTPREVPDDVRAKQDPTYGEKDFETALDRVTRRVEAPSEPDPKPPRR